MGRAPCCDKVGLKKGPWTPEEDRILINFVQKHGHSNWRALPKQAGLLRCGKSCRLRWINYLKPDIKRGNFTKEEEDTIIQLHEMMGNRWSAIAARLPGRTDNEIKNVWHTHLKKRLPQYQNKTSTPKVLGEPKVKITKSTSNTSGLTTSDQVPSSSQQSYSSATFSSNSEVSSIEVGNNMNIVKNEPNIDPQQIELEYYPIIDETFWSSEDTISDDTNTTFMIEDNNIENNQLQQSLLPGPYNNFSSFYVENDQGSYGESLNFWFDVFINAGGETELPEF